MSDPLNNTHSSACRVPFVALERQHAPLRDELQQAMLAVLDSSGFILGEEVEHFETEWAAYCRTSHCVGVASGTMAVTIALLAAGIGPGDEVIVPAHTYVASALGVIHAGARPVFCDVRSDDGLIDVAAAADVVCERSTAVMAVHLYGQVCDMKAIERFARRHGLLIVEDAAQAHGAHWRGRPVGSLGDIAAFSFYPSKNLGALGDGGAICTSDHGIAERARWLRNIGQRRKGEHVAIGFNERLDGLQAAALRVKLPHLDEWNDRRRAHAATLRAGLEGHVSLLPSNEANPVHHLFPVRVLDRQPLADGLKRRGIQTGVHYSPSVPRQPALQRHGTGQGDFPAADAWAAQELSLPMFAELSAAELEAVVEGTLRVLDDPDEQAA